MFFIAESMSQEAALLQQLKELEDKIAEDQQTILFNQQSIAEATAFLFSSSEESQKSHSRFRSLVHPATTGTNAVQRRPKTELQFGTPFIRSTPFDWAVIGVHLTNVSHNRIVSDVTGSVQFESAESTIFHCRSALLTGETSVPVMYHGGTLNPGDTAYLMLKFQQPIGSVDYSILCTWMTSQPESSEPLQRSCECGRVTFSPTSVQHIPAAIEAYADGSGDNDEVSLTIAAAQEQLGFLLQFNQMSKISCLTRITSQLCPEWFLFNDRLKSYFPNVKSPSAYDGCRIQLRPQTNVKAIVHVFAWSSLQLQRFLENCVMPAITNLDDFQLRPISTTNTTVEQRKEKLSQLDDDYAKVLGSLVAAARQGNCCQGDRYRQLRAEMLKNTTEYSEILMDDE